MQKKRVLFVCIHNSARSQMAEAFLNTLSNGRFEAESAGIEPGALNPLAIEVMKEVGIDISQNKTKGVFEFVKQGKLFNYVITVCDVASAARCPVFAGLAKRLYWSFPDPSTFGGTYEERLEKTRGVRDEIENRIIEWLNLSP